MRRLDVKPQKTLRGRTRYERAFRRDMAWIAGQFPEARYWPGDYYNWKIPVFEKVISPRHGSPEFRREVVDTLVRTAHQIATSKPVGAGHARVAAIVDWPWLFGSEVCVFFDRDYERRFDPEVDHPLSRQEFDGGWVETSTPDQDLLTNLNIEMPDGFAKSGIAFTEYDEDDDAIYRREQWVAMERIERITT